ncbi:hypothetical protein EON81_00160 [bacterium]|nr:MAG: hypothetical protein EON81_00160 [bacterium]
MSEFKPLAELDAHFEGGHLVPDQPIDLPEGVVLKVFVVGPTAEESATSNKPRFANFVGSGKNLTRLADRYIDDRETYYEDRL